MASSKSSKGKKSEVPEGSDSVCKNEHLRGPPNSIEYKLSDPRFLDIGWTVKPSSRIVGKITQYETRMAKPHMNWFHLNRKAGTKYYEDGETPFMTFSDNGSGQVFYPNGSKAIEVKRSEKRAYNLYTVFTPRGRDHTGKDREPQMLAAFDELGNGIVLDEGNNARLTYNQIGGIFRDGRNPRLWTWSLRRIKPKVEIIDTEVPSAHLQELLNLLAANSQKAASTPKSRQKTSAKNEKATIQAKDTDDRISIDESSMKNVESKREILAPLKIICLRLNSYLSLRIIDRRNISLTFSSRNRSIRIELGTILNYEQPICTLTVNVADGLRGMINCRLAVENLSGFLTPYDSLYDLAQEYRKLEQIKHERLHHWIKTKSSQMKTKYN